MARLLSRFKIYIFFSLILTNFFCHSVINNSKELNLVDYTVFNKVAVPVVSVPLIFKEYYLNTMFFTARLSLFSLLHRDNFTILHDKWYENGCKYNPVLNLIVDKVKRYISNSMFQTVIKNNKKPKAVIFDIDETVLISYFSKKAERLGYYGLYPKLNFVIRMEPIFDLYNFFLEIFREYIKEGKFKIFFVTGRSDRDSVINKTLLQLVDIGYKTGSIFFRPEDEHTILFKNRIRGELLQDYDVIAMIDDCSMNLLWGGNNARCSIWIPSPITESFRDQDFWNQILYPVINNKKDEIMSKKLYKELSKKLVAKMELE